jgi:hypothetical protein
MTKLEPSPSSRTWKTMYTASQPILRALECLYCSQIRHSYQFIPCTHFFHSRPMWISYTFPPHDTLPSPPLEIRMVKRAMAFSLIAIMDSFHHMAACQHEDHPLRLVNSKGKYRHLNCRFVLLSSQHGLAQVTPFGQSDAALRPCVAAFDLHVLSHLLLALTTTHSAPLSHTQTHLYMHCSPFSSHYHPCNHPQILFFLSHQTLPTTAPSPASRRRSQHTASAC